MEGRTMTKTTKTYAKDSLGRSTGRRFNMAAIKRELMAKIEASEKEASYRGFEISGNAGQWFVGSWETIYTSKQKAMDAVDNCLNLRAMLAAQ